MSAARRGGYWIGPEETGERDELGGREIQDRRLHGTSMPVRPPRRRRRVVAWMTVSLLVFAALAIVIVLVVTGRVVVPTLSAMLFPIHYEEEIGLVADKYGQDPYLVAAIAKAESGYDPEATSGVGAVGLMQLMPATAEWIASKSDSWPADSTPVLTDPEDSLELGVWYLDYLGEIYGEGSLLTLAAYNAGLGNVDEWIETAGGPESFDVSDIPFGETRQYVERIEHYLELYKRVHPDAFGPAAP